MFSDHGGGKNGNAWLITGNHNTKDSVNFLGTTNNVPLSIRVNNKLSGRIDSATGNTSWGYQTLQSPTITWVFGIQNTAIGYQALTSNTTGYDNTATGYMALASNTTGWVNTAFGAKSLAQNTIGGGNTAFGYGTLDFNTNGTGNTAVGYTALIFNRTGMENSAVGDGALTGNFTGSYNVAIGFQPMLSNRSGNNNVAIGNSSLYYNISGNSNTAVGNGSLFFLDSANDNTAIGSGSLSANHVGYNNTGLGSGTNVSADNLTNATAIGYNAIVDASNKVRIGNSAVTVIEGQVPFTTPSDGRYKFNIAEDVKGLDFILKLRPVTYQFDVQRFDGQMRGTAGSAPGYGVQAAYNEASRIRRSGFIAQEVEKAADAVGYDFSGIIKPRTEKDHYSLSYDAFVVPLVKAVQQQQDLILRQSRKIEDQESRIANLEQQLAEIRRLLQNSK
jgi:hypothetical protein